MTDVLDRLTLADLIDEIAARLDNAWPLHRQECLIANAIGKPCFWTRTGAERASIMLVAQTATAESLQYALERYWTGSTAQTIETLDQLIPLNHEAVMQLRLAYTGVGLYPRLAELHDRRKA